MRIAWSLPVRGERLGSSRGDLVRAASLVQALRALGHDVEVVEDAARRGGAVAVAGYRRLVRRLLPRGAALVARDLGRVAHARGHARRLAVAASRMRADVIVETQVHFAGSGRVAARRTGLPLLLDDCSPSSEEALLGCGLPGRARRVLRAQAEAADALLVPSPALRAELVREGLPDAKIHVLPNGVDLDAQDRASARREAVRRELGLADRVVLVFAGSYQPWHDTTLLPRALASIDASGLALVLAGDGPDRAACAGAAATVPGLALMDEGPVSRPRLAELLAASDVGVLPGSNDYGQPMKLLEYAAARLALVAPDLEPVRDTLGPGATGVLFEPRDAASLAAALARVVADASFRAALGSAARREVAEPASWSGRARALARIAADVTDARRARSRSPS